MVRIFVLLCIINGALSTFNSTRLVLTFANASDALSVSSLPNITIVKQYGRRIVVDLGRGVELEEDIAIMQSMIDARVLVEVDHLVHTSMISVGGSADNASSLFWNLQDSEPYSIHVESMWRKTNSTPDTVVAVLDSGLASSAFSAFMHLGQGYDFISDPDLALDADGRDSNFTDPGDAGPMCPVPTWHGTRVASVLAADHSTGMLGVAANCTLLPVRVLGMCGMGYASDVADAIVWASGGNVDGVPANPTPAKVVTMSFTGKGRCPSYLQSAIADAVFLGALPMAASGNDGLNTSNYFPANCEWVFGIAASTRSGNLANYSNFGWDIVFAAPGGDEASPILTLAEMAQDGLGLQFATGTSFSVPQAAGIAMLFAAFYPGVNLRTLLLMNNTECVQGECQIVSAIGKVVNDYHQFVDNITTITAFNNQSNFVLAQENDPQVGTRAGTTSVMTCSSGYITSLNAWAGNRLNAMDAYCTNGNVISYHGSGGSYVSVSFPAGSSQMTIGYDGDSICSLTIYSDQLTVPLAMIGGTCGSGGSGAYTVATQTCNYGEKINGFTLTVPSNPDAIYQMGIICNPMPCQGTEISPAYCTCPPGQFVTKSNGAYTCASCYPGTFSGSGAASCSSCGAGTYSGSGATGCNTCSAGTYSGSGAASCTSCGAGTFSGSGAGGCGTCNPGTFSGSNAGGCSTCGSGTYSGSGATTCSPCTSGTFSGSDAGACSLCNAGQYSGAGASSCSVCNAGTYSAQGSGGCYVCGPGTFSGSGASSCTNCPAGTVSLSGGPSCSSCGLGSYSASGAVICTTCGAGTYASASGSPTCAQCSTGTYNVLTGQTVCIQCNIGTYSNVVGAISSSACVLCPGGKYSVSTGLSSSASCINCPLGTYSMASGTACSPCLPGTYAPAVGYSACRNCSAGSYLQTSGGSSCPLCWSGTYGLFSGASSNSTCANCSIGSYSLSATSSCTACAVGTFSNVTQSPSCSFCNVSTFASSTGFTSCLYCTPGSYINVMGASFCYNCSIGFSNAGNASSCTSCSAGTFAPVVGTAPCKLCLAGKYTNATGSSYCLNCSMGTFALLGQTNCTLCAAGSFTSSNGSSVCSGCTTGTYVNFTGSSACKACFPGSFSVGNQTACTPCTTGSYSVITSASACAVCSSNTFANASGATVCFACGVNLVSSTGSSSCNNCPLGTYNGGASCVNCGAGKYSAIAGASSSSFCSSCLAGTTTWPTSSGLSACIACAAVGQFLPNQAFYVTNTIDPLVCAWTCASNYLFQNASLAPSTAAYIANGYTASEALQIFGWQTNYCCNPNTVTSGSYLSGCNRSSDGILQPCALVPNSNFNSPPASPSLNQCSDWNCNTGYYRNGSVCMKQPTCKANQTYQRDASGNLMTFSFGSYNCTSCSPCIAGSQVLVPCNGSVDTQCALCSPTTFSVAGSPCVGTMPYGSILVLQTLTSQPPFQGRPSVLSDGVTPIAWDTISAGGGLLISTYTSCAPIPASSMYTGGDNPCQEADTQLATCQFPVCNTQCKPWNGSVGWYLFNGVCQACQYDTTCTAQQYCNIAMCGPVAAPECMPCPATVIPNAVGWINPGKPMPPNVPPCLPVCRDGFNLTANGSACVPCASQPANSKIVTACNWTCSFGYLPAGPMLPNGPSLCVQCATPSTACAIGSYLGYATQCQACLPCTNTAVANTRFVSSGLSNGPNTCGTACLTGYFVNPVYGLDSFGNPVECTLCSNNVQCTAGSSYFIPCSAYADAFCMPCSACPIGFKVSSACTVTSNTTCTPCPSAPPNAQWVSAGCVSWTCNDGYYLNRTGACVLCQIPSDCTNSDSYQLLHNGCGMCVPCNASLLLPFQCFNGDGQCGVTYWCGWTSTTTVPRTTTSAVPLYYATMVSLIVPAGVPLTAQSLVMCEQCVFVRVLSINVNNVTTLCNNATECTARRRLLGSTVYVNVGLVSSSAVVAVNVTDLALSYALTSSYLVQDAPLLLQNPSKFIVLFQSNATVYVVRTVQEPQGVLWMYILYAVYQIMAIGVIVFLVWRFCWPTSKRQQDGGGGVWPQIDKRDLPLRNP